MSTRFRIITAFALVPSGISLGQMASLTWQVSADQGQSWNNSAVVAGAATVRVRAVFAWSDVPGNLETQGFGGSNFDAVILNTDLEDSVDSIIKPTPFDFIQQQLRATQFAGGLKIDPASDTAAAGQGTGWVFPGQQPEFGIIPSFNTDNPVSVFGYSLHISDMAGTREVSSIFNDTPNRALTILVTRAGATYRFSADQVTINTATITVIPAPSTAAFITLSCLGIRRRR